MADQFGLAPAPEQDTVASDDDAFLEELRKVRQSSGLEPAPSPASTPGAPEAGSSPLAQELEQSGFFEQQEAARAAQMERELQEAIARSQASAPPEPPPKGRQSGSQQQAGPAKGSRENPLTVSEFYQGAGQPGAFVRGVGGDLLVSTPTGLVTVSPGNPLPGDPRFAGRELLVTPADQVTSPLLSGLPPLSATEPSAPTASELGPEQPLAPRTGWGEVGQDLYAAGRWATQFGFQLPGSIWAGVGTVPMAVATLQTRDQIIAQSEQQWLISAFDAFDRQEAPPTAPTPYTSTAYNSLLAMYNSARPEQRQEIRASIQAALATPPTPVQGRGAYQVGEWFQRTGRELVPHLEGYDEQSIATQLSRGLGSMFVGLPASYLLGPGGGLAVFGSMGIGEATQRAVEFDRRERQAGRPGLTQEQITMAGLLGVAPGTTDVIPVENLLGRLPIRIPPMVQSALARVVARIGGQALIEGVQEGGQEILQDIIAKLVYDPNQVIGEQFWESAGLGAGVGGIAEGGRTAGGALFRVARALRGGRSTTQPGGGETAPPTPPPAPEAAPAPTPTPEAGAPQAGAPAAETAPEATAQPAPETFGFDLPVVPPQAAPEGATAAPEAGAAPVAPEAETAPAPAPAPPESAPEAQAPQDAEEQLRQTVERILQERPDALSPEETAIIRRMAERFAPAGTVAEQAQSGPREIVTPDGSMSVQATPEVVDLATLTAASGALQPRDRSRAESQTAIRQIAANLDPEQLRASRVSDSGAPIVSADGTVISGNGRIAALRQVYTDPALRERAEAYRRMLGPQAQGMAMPVLVTRLPQMEQAELARFADLSNRSRIGAMSATERAQRDAASAGAEVMGAYQGGEFTSPANQEFFRAFSGRVVSEAERGAFSRDGNLTKEGQDRMRAAVLAAAYGDADLLSRMLESTDDNIKSLTGALQDAAGAFIRLKEAIRVGEADARFDITPNVVDAVRTIADLRSRDMRPDMFLAQQDAFNQIDPIVEGLIRGFYNDTLSRPLSRQKIAGVLTDYASEAAKHTSDGLIPDETTPEQIVGFAREKALREDTLAERLAQAQGDIFARPAAEPAAEPAVAPGGPSPARGPDAGVGREGAGRGAPERGAETGAESQQPAAVAAPTPAQSQQLRGIIASRFPLNWGTIQARLGVTPEQMEALRQEALNEGLLRQTKDGAYRRVPQATAPQAGPDLSVSPQDRVDGAIRALEVQTGRQVSEAVRAYAVELLSRLGMPSHAATLDRAKADKSLKAADVRDLAAIAGTPVAKNAKKDTAFASIQKRSQDHRAFLERQTVETGIRVDLASFQSATSDGQSQAVEFDAIGYFSKALEAAKAWPQKKGTPQQVLQHLLKAGTGVKNEIEALGLEKWLEGKKSVTRDEVVAYLRDNRVEVREAVYRAADPAQADSTARMLFGRPWDQLTAAEQAQLVRDVDVSTAKGKARWRSYSLAKDDGNPTYQETVLHLPEESLPGARALQDEYDRLTRERATTGFDNIARTYEIQERMQAIDSQLRALEFKSGHFPEPNIVANTMSSLNRLGDETTFAVSQVQSDWGQEILKRTRDAVTKQLFETEWKARQAEFEQQLEEARQANGPDLPQFNLFVTALRQGGTIGFDDLPKSLRSEVSAAISEARARGEIPAGARDERKIADLEKRQKEAEAAVEAAAVPARAWLAERAKTDKPTSEAIARVNGNGRIAINDLAPVVVRNILSWRDAGERAAELLAALRTAISQNELVSAELDTAKASAPSHPFVNTTDAWLTFTLKHVVRQAIASGATSISIPSGDTVLAYNPQGSEEGNEEFYNRIVPIALGKILKAMDGSIKPRKVQHVQSPVDGRDLGSGFVVFPITDKVREQVNTEGMALFAVASRGSDPQAPTPQPVPNAPQYTEAFKASLPGVAARLERWARKMLPQEVAVRVVDRITIDGQSTYAAYSYAEAPGGIFAKSIEVALTTNAGFSSYRTMLVKAFHEVVHALREHGRVPGGIYGTLLTDQEWQVVVERAKKIGIDKYITVYDKNGKVIPGVPVYRRIYREMLQRVGFTGNIDQRIEETIDQERVARLAELWAEGTSFGKKVDSWFERLVQFVEAIRNALRGLGFQTYNDVFRAMASGEVARRAEGGRREPTFDPFPIGSVPSPSQVHLSSEEGMAARGLFPAIRAFHASPSDFDRFSSEFIGTGEGAQAFSYGLYFADLTGTARSYLVSIGSKDAVRQFRAALPDDADFDEIIARVDAGDVSPPMARLLRALAANDWLGFDYPAQAISQAFRRDLVDNFDPTPELVSAVREYGHLYEVSLDVEPQQLLDWDKPLGEQGETGRKVARLFGPVEGMEEGEDILTYRGHWRVTDVLSRLRDQGIDRARASELMREAGVPGVRYLDQVSRAAGEGSRNYVIFDDSLIKIVAKDGKPVSSEERADVLQQMQEEQDGGANLASFASTGLDMSPRARKARAKVMGFDTSTVYYHGSRKFPFEQFRVQDPRSDFTIQAYGTGVYLTPSSQWADAWSNGGPVEPFYVRLRNPFVWDQRNFKETERRLRGLGVPSSVNLRAEGIQFEDEADAVTLADALRVQGYDGVTVISDAAMPGVKAGEVLEIVVFNPSNIRSTNAAFDLAQEGSPTLLASFTSDRPAPETRPVSLSLPNLSASVTETVKEGGERMRTYRVGPETVSGEAQASTSLIVSEQPDGGWELTFFKAEPDQLSKLPEIVAAIEAQDIGKPISPRGWLTPQGYAFWQQKAPDRVRFHQNAGDLFGGMFASPRAIEFAEAVLAEAAASGQNQPMPAEIPVKSAIRMHAFGGRIFEGNGEHADVAKAAYRTFEQEGNEAAMDAIIHDDDGFQYDNGFITNRGRFVSREEAYVLVRDAGLMLRRGEGWEWLDSGDLPDIAAAARRAQLDAASAPNRGSLSLEGMESALAHLSRLKQSLPPSVFEEARREERYGTSPITLASFQGMPPPGNPPPGSGAPMLPVTPASTGEVRGIADVIADLKSALGMTVTQGLDRMRVRGVAGGRTWSFRPQRGIRGQYDANAGVARVSVATDIDAIAEQGGRHIERVFGASMQAFLQQHAEELGVPPAPDTPLPQIAPTGFSGIELDADTQRTLVEAAEATRAWQAAQTYDNAAQAAIARRTLERRLGRTVAQALLADIIGAQPLGSAAAPADPAGLAIYVQARYSATGTPTARVAPTIPPAQLSQAFATFFRRYITDPDGVKRDMPGVFVGFETFLDANDPAMLQDLERVQLQVVSADYKQYRLSTAWEQAQADSASMQPETAWEKLQEWYRVGNTWGGRWDSLKQWLSWTGSFLSYEGIDTTNPLLKSQQALLRMHDEAGHRDADGRPISLRPSQDAHRISRMMAGADKIAYQVIARGVPDYDGLEPIGPSLHDALVLALGGTRAWQWSKKAIKRFGTYLEARRAVAEWPRFLAGEIGQPTRRNLAENQQIIAEAEAANPSYRQAAQMVYDWQHRLLTMEWRAGKWTDEAYAALSKRKDFYVPFMRDISDLVPTAGAPPGTQMARRFTEGHRFEGSLRDIINPIESLVKRAYETIAAIQYNDMVKTLLANAEGVPGGGRIIERVTKEETLEANKRTFALIVERAIAMGMDPADAHLMVSKMEHNFTDAHVHILADPEHFGPNRPLMVPLWERGERKLVRLNDYVMGRRLFDAMNALGREHTNIWIRAIAWPASLLRAGVTMHPTYIFSNALGDAQAAWTLTGAPPVITQAKGLWYLASTNPTAQAAMRAVGITPPNFAQMYASVGGMSGGVNTAAIRALGQNFDLRELRRKGFSVVDLPSFGALGLVGAGAAVGAYTGSAIGAIAAPVGAVIGAIYGGRRLTGKAVGAATGAAAAVFTPSVVGATLGAGAGAMVARAVFGEGAGKFFAALSEASESSTRLGVAAHAAARARKLYPNMSDIDLIREGAFTARDVADFDRRGARAATVLKLIPFLNGNIQPTSKAYRQALVIEGDRGRVNMEKIRLYLRWKLTRTQNARAALNEATSPREEQAIADGARAWINMMILMAVGSALYMAFKDDPEYDDVRKEVRDTHFVFKLWGTWFRVKKPFELAFPANIAEAVFDWMRGTRPSLMTQIRDSFLETHMPPVMPQIYNLLTGWRTGIDPGRPFERAPRPIVPEALSRLPSYMQYNAYSSAFAIQWSRALHALGINISPMMIDWTLNNELAYWGREIRVSSDYLFSSRAPQWADMPIIGTMLNRFRVIPGRGSASVDEFWALMGRGRGEFDEAHAGYDRRLREGNPEAVRTYLAGLSRDEVVYSVLMQHFSAEQKSAHPLTRAGTVFRINSAMRREIAEPDGLISSDPATRGQTIALSPAERAQVDDILGRLSAIEAWNALHAVGRAGWAGREVRDPEPVLAELRAASQTAYDELMRRRTRGRVGTWQADMQRWSQVEQEVERMIRDENMLGLAWERTFNRRRVPTRRMQESPGELLPLQ